MVKQIRLSTAEARTAGLLDPDVSHLVSKTAARRGGKKVDAEGSKPKRKRSKSRPAIHPVASLGPSGKGKLTLDAQGAVDGAEFVFDLVPVPKERPRVVKNAKTGDISSYTPTRTKYFSKEVTRVVEHVFAGRAPIEGPVRLDMTFVMKIPKSWPRWKRSAALEGLIAPTGRPDMDNLEKALLDAFNETLIVDDAYVIDRRATKIYGEMPAIMTRVSRTGQAGLNVRRSEVEALRRLRDETDPTGPAPAPAQKGKNTDD